jgi:hypothetical protein
MLLSLGSKNDLHEQGFNLDISVVIFFLCEPKKTHSSAYFYRGERLAILEKTKGDQILMINRTSALDSYTRPCIHPLILLYDGVPYCLGAGTRMMARHKYQAHFQSLGGSSPYVRELM